MITVLFVLPSFVLYWLILCDFQAVSLGQNVSSAAVQQAKFAVPMKLCAILCARLHQRRLKMTTVEGGQSAISPLVFIIVD